MRCPTLGHLLVLLALSGTAACVAADGSSCNPLVPCGVGNDSASGGAAPSVWFDSEVELSDGAPGRAVPARGGTTALVERRTAVLAGSTATVETPGATLVAAGGGAYLLAAGANDVVEIRVVGEAATGDAYDGVARVLTRPVARVTAAPRVDYVVAGAAVAYHVDAPELTIQLADATLRLADLSLTLGAATSDGVTQPLWDRVRLPAVPGAYHVEIVADSFGARAFDVTVVADVDRLAADWDGARADNRLCFHAYRGDLEVFAPAWSFTSIQGHRADGPNCVYVYQPGAVTAEAGGMTYRFEVD